VTAQVMGGPGEGKPQNGDLPASCVRPIGIEIVGYGGSDRLAIWL
jgi:hypothetical protein